VTQMEQAQRGQITDEMEKVAKAEDIDVQKLRRRLAEGRIIIPKNVNRKSDPLGIGKGLRTKVNANVGSSSELEDVKWEVEKAKTAVRYGADTVMDLSTGSDFNKIREGIMQALDVPIGTVPIYESAVVEKKVP
jgi:phosphomethylpyrimidine synthase